jgi:hypothetical protein
MAEEVSIHGLRSKQAARRAGIMVRVQAVIILLFIVWISEEYNHNQYFQAWAAKNLGVLAFTLNGTLAAFYAGLLIALFLNQPLPPANVHRLKRREPVPISPEAR